MLNSLALDLRHLASCSWRRNSSAVSGGHVALEHVGRMQLTEQLDHFVLRTALSPSWASAALPDLLNGALGHPSVR